MSGEENSHMKLLKRFLLLNIFLASLSSCKKDHTPSPAIPAGPPRITSFAPTAAAKDSGITIMGENFSTTVGANIVTINNVPATVLSAAGNLLRIKVPAHAGTGIVHVQVGTQGASATALFTYLYTVTTLAGDGHFGYKNGAGNIAEFNASDGISIDGDGNIYVADVVNNRIRRITAGQVTTWAGDGSATFKEGNGTAAAFNNPYGVATTAAGITFVTDAVNNRIRRITATADVSTLAGSDTAGYRDGAGAKAQFKDPEGVAVDAAGNVYIADTYNSSIRKISTTGVVTTLAGNGTYGYQEGTGSAARFSFPRGLAVDAAGYVFVADGDNSRIRRISPAGEVTTLAGSGNVGFLDGDGANAKFNQPHGVADGGHGFIYVADMFNHCIRQISPTGFVTTIAGDGTPGYKDGAGPNAEFNAPYGIAADNTGILYVVDAGNYRIRKLE